MVTKEQMVTHSYEYVFYDLSLLENKLIIKKINIIDSINLII